MALSKKDKIWLYMVLNNNHKLVFADEIKDCNCKDCMYKTIVERLKLKRVQ